jgi:hypothetical protein
VTGENLVGRQPAKLAKAAPPAMSTPQKGLGGFDFVLPNGDLIRNTEHPYNAV